MERGAWQAAVHGVAKSQTWRKRLSMHGENNNCHWWPQRERNAWVQIPFLCVKTVCNYGRSFYLSTYNGDILWASFDTLKNRKYWLNSERAEAVGTWSVARSLLKGTLIITTESHLCLEVHMTSCDPETHLFDSLNDFKVLN